MKTKMGLEERQGAKLKCRYTSAFSLSTKQDELEVTVQQAKYDLVAITETFWDHFPNWSAATDMYKHIRRGRQRSRGSGVALC